MLGLLVGALCCWRKGKRHGVQGQLNQGDTTTTVRTVLPSISPGRSRNNSFWARLFPDQTAVPIVRSHTMPDTPSKGLFSRIGDSPPDSPRPRGERAWRTRRCVSFDHGDDANGDLDLEVSLCLDLDREKDLDASPQHVSATFSFDVDA